MKWVIRGHCLLMKLKGGIIMEVRYYCECYHRTLVVKFPEGYSWLKKETELMLDQFYDEWVNFEGPYETEEIEDMCLEDYMMERLSETYNMWTEWTVEED